MLVVGSAKAPALVLDAPLSLWGGYDVTVGKIVDRHHPQFGASAVNCVLVMPRGRGSSSSAGALLEAVRLQTAPKAFILSECDDILTVGALAAGELYGRWLAMVVAPDAVAAIGSGDEVAIAADGRIAVVGSAPPAGAQ